MATRTVRLDEEAEAALLRIRKATGLPISEALKRGLHAFQESVGRETRETPYDVYRQLDLGAGGWAIAPATDSRRAVAGAIRRKHGR
ncbi:MAG: hypothetical protein AB1806_21085 [Acidobacteriota bacterium]